jgi:hypothetical protein
MVAAYRKKPMVIQALQWKGDNEVEVLQFCSKCFIVTGDSLKINTLEGTMSASVGDYIIKGVRDEFYPCKPDIFALTYDQVSE